MDREQVRTPAVPEERAHEIQVATKGYRKEQSEIWDLKSEI